MTSAAIRLTAAQAAVRYLAGRMIGTDGGVQPFFAGVWSIFGHGNVAGIGEALHAHRADIRTFRAHNEQAMAHAAIAFAKASRRQRAMICTTSIGPGATNLVTAAAVAHVNRLPVLFLPGDVYAGRRPGPVLQQIENVADATASANDCLRPVSRFFDRITRPEQLMEALPRAMAVLTDPAECGPATIAFCQDVQAEAWDFPEDFFAPQILHIRRPQPDPTEMARLRDALRDARAPLIVAGGGVLYSGAEQALADFAGSTGIPVAETQAGKGCLAADHPEALGAIGVTGTAAANAAAAAADLVIGIGTRLQDFTTGSRTLFGGSRQDLVQVNVSAFDAAKHGAATVVGDALSVIAALAGSDVGQVPAEWSGMCARWRAAWQVAAEAALAPPTANGPPSDAQVIGIASRRLPAEAVIVAAAGGLPGELHKLWPIREPGTYHCEYGYSCMGYEIAGGLGVKLARPDSDVVVMVGDGSYLMMNSEIATSVAMRLPLIILLLDNRGFGCIDRLQRRTGSAGFNNLFRDVEGEAVEIDFVAHARSLGAIACRAAGTEEIEAAIDAARVAARTSVIVIDTDPAAATEAGGHWWDVAVPQISSRAEVTAARTDYDAMLSKASWGRDKA